MTTMYFEAEWGEVKVDVINWLLAVIQNLEPCGSSLGYNKHLTHCITTLFPSQRSCVPDLRTLLQKI